MKQIPRAVVVTMKKLEAFEKTHDQSYLRASLAKLRRGAGRSLESSPETWELIFSDFSDSDFDNPRVFDNDIEVPFTVLTLYAVHRQGGKIAHKKDFPLGRALGVLRVRLGEDGSKSMTRRFDQLITAKSFSEIRQYARGLIQILRQNDLPFDYKKFANDIYWLNIGKKQIRQRVLRRWGRDYWTIDSEIKGADPLVDLKDKEDSSD
ncbi:MAG: type I-E CRISPR-associated protein Cse2/CasB [Bifidobacteriaceae bacterium]|jgi:CRISPR system Cascade subunit CasB|nr:type I-E CRISPR-associated protein Cse2/CasB [Bifidobacteriaceae bacterium]